MRVTITVTDDQGQTFEGELDLAPTTKRRSAGARARPAPPAGDARIDFGLPRRAFLKKHARGSGPQKFAVLLAHMTQGKTGVPITRDAVETEWMRNKGVLGGDFQTMYATRSRENTWSDSPKRGTFVLRAEWRGALTK
jgi:hypothetical protein